METMGHDRLVVLRYMLDITLILPSGFSLILYAAQFAMAAFSSGEQWTGAQACYVMGVYGMCQRSQATQTPNDTAI
jgi:hypothetical protein